MACQNMCCGCQNSSGRAQSCSPPLGNAMSPGRRDSLAVNACGSHPCLHAVSPPMSAPTGMMGLSTEAYQLLAEQDKQLKLLQAQIQRLLEAQTSQGDSKSTQKCLESTAAGTEDGGHTRKSSVSIAVSTGASLFWNSPPCPEEEESPNKQDESELCNGLSAAVNNEQDTSRTSIASSLQAVDICSFAESSQLTECGGISPPAPMPVCYAQNKSTSQAKLDRAQSCVTMETESPERSGSRKAAELGVSMPSLPPGKFYQDLLSQVNNLLKTSTSSHEEYCEKDSRAEYETDKSHSEKSREPSSRNTSQTDQGNVLRATLRQLRSLGVDMEPEEEEVKTDSVDSGDNACVLACINPEAVFPRLNYMSFTNMGLSGFIPNGVDLSMEANAIALKYLSEAQLTQLSLSHANKTKPVDSSSLHNLFAGGTEKSMAGLSLISPSNMSFATRKYLKRYALIESNDSSDEEPDLPSGSSSANSDQPDRNKSASSSNSSSESLEFGSEPKQILRNPGRDSLEASQNKETNKLRNITNEIPGKVHAGQASEEASLCFLKDLNTGTKFTSTKAQFTAHPEKENGRNSPLFNAKDSNTSGKRNAGPASSVGDFLDVNRLRQLPKLF